MHNNHCFLRNIIKVCARLSEFTIGILFMKCKTIIQLYCIAIIELLMIVFEGLRNRLMKNYVKVLNIYIMFQLSIIEISNIIFQLPMNCINGFLNFRSSG